MSWLRRILLVPGRGRLQFIKHAPSIQVRPAEPAVIDEARILTLTDALVSVREELTRAREPGRSSR